MGSGRHRPLRPSDFLFLSHLSAPPLMSDGAGLCLVEELRWLGVGPSGRPLPLPPPPPLSPSPAGSLSTGALRVSFCMDCTPPSQPCMRDEGPSTASSDCQRTTATGHHYTTTHTHHMPRVQPSLPSLLADFSHFSLSLLCR